MFSVLMMGMQDKKTQAALFLHEKSMEYCREENRILRELLEKATGTKRIWLTDNHRRRLAVKGFALGSETLASVITMFQPDTIIGWYKRLVAKKYDSSTKRQKGGKEPVSQEIIDSVLRFARRNVSCGNTQAKEGQLKGETRK